MLLNKVKQILYKRKNLIGIKILDFSKYFCNLFPILLLMINKDKFSKCIHYRLFIKKHLKDCHKI